MYRLAACYECALFCLFVLARALSPPLSRGSRGACTHNGGGGFGSCPPTAITRAPLCFEISTGPFAVVGSYLSSQKGRGCLYFLKRRGMLISCQTTVSARARCCMFVWLSCSLGSWGVCPATTETAHILSSGSDARQPPMCGVALLIRPPARLLKKQPAELRRGGFVRFIVSAPAAVSGSMCTEVRM